MDQLASRSFQKLKKNLEKILLNKVHSTAKQEFQVFDHLSSALEIN